MLKYLEELCCLSGVSGDEGNVREFIEAHAKKYADSIRTDALGNLIVFKKGKVRGTKLMLSAHMDEVGFMVEKITDDGYLKFGMVGGIDPRVILGRKVYVGPYAIPGVMGLKAIHLTTAAERSEMPKTSSLYIDIGAKNKREAEKYVSLGDYVSFDSDFALMGNKFVKAKAIDDRFGCAVLLNLLEHPLPQDVTFVFTAMEEVGARGAFGSAFSVKPKLALVIEGTTAADYAGVAENKKVTRCGEGPVLGFMDSGAVYDRGLFEMTRDLAEEKNIPWQMKGRIAGGTDAQAIQRSLEGIRVANISVPVRNIHSPNSVANIEDIDNAYKLAQLFIKAVSEGKYK
ncbi:MAG: M42 family metallopeptidase [Clostridia bacterium]|nr:M42 family metallopeptidase [Clostridia bacterium]